MESQLEVFSATQHLMSPQLQRCQVTPPLPVPMQALHVLEDADGATFTQGDVFDRLACEAVMAGKLPVTIGTAHAIDTAGHWCEYLTPNCDSERTVTSCRANPDSLRRSVAPDERTSSRYALSPRALKPAIACRSWSLLIAERPAARRSRRARKSPMKQGYSYLFTFELERGKGAEP